MSVKSGKGLAFVAVIVTLAIVLILAARNAQQVAPVLHQIPAEPKGIVESNPHGQPEAVEALGEVPDLDQLRQLTGDHAQELQDALEQIE